MEVTFDLFCEGGFLHFGIETLLLPVRWMIPNSSFASCARRKSAATEHGYLDAGLTGMTKW